MSATTAIAVVTKPRHAVWVRVTHWLTLVAFVALLVSGLELVVSHPRFYWGETGNSGTTPAFIIPIPSSRDTVPTGYRYQLPDQNGWSRYLHFEAAWVLVFAGLVYGIAGLWSGHFWREIVPRDWNWRAYWAVMVGYWRKRRDEGRSYNALQRAAYFLVIFGLFPLVIWTGLALSPSFDSAVPAAVNLLGGRQSARTLHFFVTWALVAFVVVHVAMVIHAGFWSRMRGMTIGSRTPKEES